MTVTNPTRMAQPAAKQTLIEDDTEFKGKLSSKCPVVVKGTVDGEIAGPSLHVSASGTVSGQVKVTELRSEGTIGGEHRTHLERVQRQRAALVTRPLQPLRHVVLDPQLRIETPYRRQALRRRPGAVEPRRDGVVGELGVVAHDGAVQVT